MLVISCEFARQLETYTCDYFVIVLGYPFLHQFNPLINWKHRTVQFIHKGTTDIIPVVEAYGNPHQPMSVDEAEAELQALQSAAEPNQQLPPPPLEHVMAQKALLVKC